MARQGIPRIRHLKHRSLGRVKRQPIITDFLTERSTTLSQYANSQAVWDALKTSSTEAVAAEVSAA